MLIPSKYHSHCVQLGRKTILLRYNACWYHHQICGSGGHLVSNCRGDHFLSASCIKRISISKLASNQFSLRWVGEGEYRGEVQGWNAPRLLLILTLLYGHSPLTTVKPMQLSCSCVGCKPHYTQWDRDHGHGYGPQTGHWYQTCQKSWNLHDGK